MLRRRRSARRWPTSQEKKKYKGKLDILVGTMIEIPRACVDGRRDRRDRRLLQLRHERPDADDVRLQPRRHQHVPARLPASRKSCSRDPFQSLDTTRRRPAGRDGRHEGPLGARRTSSAASAASTAATRTRSSSATRSGSITSRAARSACRSPGWPRPKRRSSNRARTRGRKGE